MCLYRLLAGLSPQDRSRHQVFCMMSPGPMADNIQKLGVPVTSLHMRRGMPSIPALLKFSRIVRELKPAVLQGWMYHGCLLASLTALLQKNGPAVLWCIHNSLTHINSERRMTRLVIRVLAVLSWHPRHIIYVAHRSALQHHALGYSKAHTVIIPNGYDLRLFCPDPLAAAQLRSMLELSPATRLIGLVGRWDWTKDHANFITALADVPGAHAVMIGKDIDGDNQELATIIEKYHLHDRVHLLGYRSDVPALMAGLDLLCLSSCTESMPNVVGEAMACGVPCVVTDVGDAADMVGDTGWGCPPQDPKALAAALNIALHSDLSVQGQAARTRIATCYTQERMIESFQTLYTTMEISDVGR